MAAEDGDHLPGLDPEGEDDDDLRDDARAVFGIDVGDDPVALAPIDLDGEDYSFPDGPPDMALARARLDMARQGTGTIGTAARRAVPDSATMPSWQPRHGPIRSETCHAVPFGPVALQCPC
jgi:hypothetical protein